MSEAKQFDGGRFAALMFWLVPTSIFRAWAFSVLWRWFVVPVTDFAEIGVAVSYGLLLVVTLLGPTNSDDDESPVAEIVVKSVTVSLLALAFGWVALQVAS